MTRILIKILKEAIWMNASIWSQEIKRSAYQLFRQADVTMLAVTTLFLYSYSDEQKLTW